MDDFEQELHQALERRPAPPSLKRNLMARRRNQSRHAHTAFWQKLAASLAFAAALAGGATWGTHIWQQRAAQQRALRQQQELREGEAARQQVLIALRITSHALDHMNRQLAAHNQSD
jgi:hypothetical protein